MQEAGCWNIAELAFTHASARKESQSRSKGFRSTPSQVSTSHDNNSITFHKLEHV